MCSRLLRHFLLCCSVRPGRPTLNRGFGDQGGVDGPYFFFGDSGHDQFWSGLRGIAPNPGVTAPQEALDFDFRGAAQPSEARGGADWGRINPFGVVRPGESTIAFAGLHEIASNQGVTEGWCALDFGDRRSNRPLRVVFDTRTTRS